ncbi:MAG: helix-turn-helix domain-containing protein [Janthinobacterium lividum]
MVTLTRPRSISPSEMIASIPARCWLQAPPGGVDDVAVYGLECDPYGLSTYVGSHTVIAYVDGKSRLTRRFEGRELSAEVEPGDLVLKSFGTAGEWLWDRPNSAIQVFLSPNLLQGLATTIYGPRAGTVRLRDSVKTQDDEVLALMHALAREAGSDEPGSSIMVKALAQQLALHLLRRHSDLVPNAPPRSLAFSDLQRSRIIQFITRNLDKAMPATEMARRENLGADRFIQLFRNTFGCSPQEHVRALRLQRACELMDDPSRSLAEIAYQTGFVDQSHLTRVFKQRFGEPPGIWRSRQLAAERCIGASQ